MPIQYGNMHIQAHPPGTVGRMPDTVGHPGTVGFDLSDAAAIAQIGASLLPAFGVKDKTVLRLADIAGKGLSLASAADKGNVRSAIQAGTQIAQRLSEQFKLGPEVQRALEAASQVGMGLAARELTKNMQSSVRAVNYYQKQYDEAVASGEMEKANEMYSTLYRARAQLAVDDLQLRRAAGEKVAIPLDLATEARQGPLHASPGPLPPLPGMVDKDKPALVSSNASNAAKAQAQTNAQAAADAKARGVAWTPPAPPPTAVPVARPTSTPPPPVLKRSSIPGANALPAMPTRVPPGGAATDRLTVPGEAPPTPAVVQPVPRTQPVQSAPRPQPAWKPPAPAPALPRPTSRIPGFPPSVQPPAANVCVPGNSPACNTRGTGFGTIRSTGDTSCCRIKPTERGVLIVEGSMGNATPGAFWEAPAGDYYNIQCTDARRLTPESRQFERPDGKGRIPACISTGGADMSQLVVPEDWSVELWSEPGFGGQVLELFEGKYDLRVKGWADKVKSMRIRGPWTIVDGLISNELGRQAEGWMTQKSRAGLLTPYRVADAVMNDPLRPESPARFDDPIPEWQSAFRPGWEERLKPMWTPGSGVGSNMLSNFRVSLQDLDLMGFVLGLKTRAEGIAAAQKLRS